MRRTTRWFLAVACLAAWGLAAPAPAAAIDDGFQSIFDGKTLDGWDGNPKYWRVEDGTITGETTKENPAKGNTFIVWRKGKPADFELQAEFRMTTDWANSGIQYRSWEEPEKWGKWVIGGYQADMDSGNTYTGACYGERYRGMLCNRGQKTVIGENHQPKVVGQTGDAKELREAIKDRDWNTYRIVAKGFHFTQQINGKLTAEFTDEDKEQRRADGLIALQLHAGPPMKVQFRNIKLKVLKSEGKAQGAKETSGKKKVVFVAGPKSHGYASHAHYAGCKLLGDLLEKNVPGIRCVVYRDGWPKDPKAFHGAAAIVIYSDGGGGQPIVAHLDQVEPLMKKGVGLALLHYAVEVPKGKPGDKILQWAGGYFETYWSVNPFWKAEFKSFPDHPITRGVKPFAIDDEWYYHMRFPENMEGVTPILTAVPPDSTRREGNDAHGANPTVRARKGMPEHVAWAIQRKDGGRGFGFTGGHNHWNWACDGFRTTVLNAIVWVAGLDVPEGGVPSKTPTFEELEQNQDYRQPKNFDRKHWQDLIRQWNGAK